MLGVKVWRRVLGVDDRVVIEGVDYDEDADVASIARSAQFGVGRHGPAELADLLVPFVFSAWR